MAFRTTENPDVVADPTGRLMRVGRETVALLRNNGQITDTGSGLAGGGMSSEPTPMSLSSGETMSQPIERLTGVTGVPSQTAPASQFQPRLQGIPQEYGGAPPAPPADRSGRIPVTAPGSSVSGHGSSGGLPPGVILERTAPTKGDWQGATRSVQGIKQEQQNVLEQTVFEATRRSLEANQKQADAAYAGAEAEEEFLRNRTVDEQVKRLDTEERIKSRNDFAKTQLSELDAMIEDAAATKIVDHGVFKRAETPTDIAGGVLGILGAALKEYSVSQVGGVNTVLQMIQRSSEENVKNQRDQIQTRIANAREKRSMLDRNTAVGNEADAALLKAVNEREFALALRAVQKNADLKIVHPLAAAAEAKILEQSAQTLTPIYNSVQRQSTERYVSGSPGGVRVKVDPVLEAGAKAAGLIQVIEGKANPKHSEVYGGGGKVVGGVESGQAKAINESAIAARSLVRTLRGIAAIQRKGNNFSANDIAELKRLGIGGALDIAKQRGFRVGTEADMANAKEAVGAGDFDFFVNSGAFQAEQALQDVISQTHDLYNHYGLDDSELMQELTNEDKLD